MRLQINLQRMAMHPP